MFCSNSFKSTQKWACLPNLDLKASPLTNGDELYMICADPGPPHLFIGWGNVVNCVRELDNHPSFFRSNFYTKSTNFSKIHSNLIWFDDGYSVKNSFLRKYVNIFFIRMTFLLNFFKMKFYFVKINLILFPISIIWKW